MVLAKFFDKAALAASQVLQGYDFTAFAGRLQSTVVGIAFDETAVGSAEGGWTLELTTNLLARLYPRVAILPLSREAEGLSLELERRALSINPVLEIEHETEEVSVCIVIGITALPDNPHDQKPLAIYVGSDGWIALLSTERPVGSGESDIPFGAGAAACFGAANVFRAVFKDQLPDGALDRSILLSLLDYDPQASAPSNPQLKEVHFGETHLIGLGAIGNGAIWALARTPHLEGILHLIDDETIELSNLQRYVLTTQAHVDDQKRKVTLAVEALKGADLSAVPHVATWAKYLGTRENWYFERVAVAVDSAEDRRSAQACLPKWLVNAWTQPGNLGISRHSFVRNQACLTCLYFPEGGQRNEDQLVAQAIGLPDQVSQVRAMLYTNAPVGRESIGIIAAALGVEVEPLLRFEGLPLRSFYTEAICGGVVMRLGGHTNRGVAEVPMAFQSALAGIMLAGELVAHAAGIRQSPPPVTTTIDLLRPLGSYMSMPITKHTSGLCICQDPDYREAYRAKYDKS
jgi:molybdopterin/thiamine biosynthesis adenylyltransferase